MKIADIPYKFAEPWAINATGTLVTNPIPITTAGTAAASQSLGFPPATALPTGSGGTPPAIWDFNGALFYETSWSRWVQAGGPVTYDSTFQTAIGGYPKSAVIQSATHTGKFWVCEVDDNTTNPDTGGANWVQLGGSGYQQYTTGSGNFTVPPYVFTIDVEAWGAGGGAGGVANNGSSGGGSGGGYCRKSIAVNPGDSVPYAVGAAGTAGTSSINGGTGGTTTFGTGPILSAIGGTGGQFGDGFNGIGGTTPGTGTGGDENYSGDVGIPGLPNFGGGSGGAFKSPGGASGGINASPGTPPFPGAGGRGTSTSSATAFNGAPGASGKIIIRWKVGQ